MTPEARMAIESILMVADQPVEASVLAQLLEVPKADVEAACVQLAADYEANGRGFILAQVAGGYRFQSHPELAPYVERFVLDGQSSRLSNAALETLAIVAYKQPISRMQVAAIRGVNVDGVLRTLQQRGYVDEVSRDPGPGNAVLFGTTALFLERVGLNALADLPPLAEFVPGADVVEALEDGLRPEPLSDLAVEAAAMAEVHADDGGDGESEPSSVDADAGSGPAEIEDEVEERPDTEMVDDVAVEVDDVAVEAEVEDDDLEAEDEDDRPEGEAETSPGPDAAVAENVPIADVTDPGSDEVIDLSIAPVVVGEGSPEASRVPAPDSSATSPMPAATISSTVRHDPRVVDAAEADRGPEVADHEPAEPPVPFRSTPGVGTGGLDNNGATGLDVGEAQGDDTAASDPSLTRDQR